MRDVLTKRQVRVLNEARELLLEIKEATTGEHSDTSRAYRLGMLQRTAVDAEEAVFAVINVASSYLDSDNATAAHDRWLSEAPARSERLRAKRQVAA